MRYQNLKVFHDLAILIAMDPSDGALEFQLMRPRVILGTEYLADLGQPSPVYDFVSY